MRHDYDVIVIGSGFGGATAAAVLAGRGRTVCVLERGKAYAPGTFARSPADTARSFWGPSDDLDGLIQLWNFRRTDAIVSSGLGGGSLIYANVMLRKPEDSYVRWDWRARREAVGWPVDAAQLAPSYAWAEQQIGVAEVPEATVPGYDVVRRTAYLQQAEGPIRSAGFPVTFKRPPVAVSFAGADGRQFPGAPLAPDTSSVHTHLTGLPAYRSACRLCGECNLGCNYGSKNSLDHTLLSVAVRHGAEVRPQCEVKAVERLPGDGWRVTYVDGAARRAPGTGPAHAAERCTLTAAKVVLAAGTLGSTYLLLRMREEGQDPRRAPLRLSPALGHCFSGNGDFITWVTGAQVRLDGDRGPVVTGMLECLGDRHPGGDPLTNVYFYVQDGGYPGLLSWLGEVASPSTGARLGRFALRRWEAALRRDPNRHLARDVAGLVGTSRSTTTLPLLGIGMDVADGQLRLSRRNSARLELATSPRRSSAYYEEMTSMMARVAAAWGGRLIDSPWWAFGRSVTVHPLGGCPMGETADDGVVDEYGEVFGNPGLHVLDGSVMPGPVGPNPALTIAAFAHRAAERMSAAW